MAEYNRNLWAPWRMEYIRSLEEHTGGGCFLCRHAAAPEQDGSNLVIWRGPRCLTMFNRFPYASGHLLVAPAAHRARLDEFDAETLAELIGQIRDAQALLREVCGCQGMNIGMNFGRCAGAGLPDHLHAHLVPRWEGDVNFMPVLSDTRVIPESIDALRGRMREAVARLGLPAVRG